MTIECRHLLWRSGNSQTVFKGTRVHDLHQVGLKVSSRCSLARKPLILKSIVPNHPELAFASRYFGLA
jgi:hypothetical protein